MQCYAGVGVSSRVEHNTVVNGTTCKPCFLQFVYQFSLNIALVIVYLNPCISLAQLLKILFKRSLSVDARLTLTK
jgi:hypothetical protein